MKTIFAIHDKLTGDAFEIEHDRRGDRLLVHSAIDREGERVMVLVDARKVGRCLAEVLLAELGDAPAPRTRSTKALRRAELAR